MATIEQRIYDGNRAKEVLENEAFNAAFADIEKEVIEQWKTSPARDEVGREKLWQYLMLLQKVKTHLVSTLETGKLTEFNLNQEKSMAEKMKAGIASFLA